MIFATVLAGLHLVALAVSALDPIVGRNLFALEQTALGLVVLAWTPARQALIAALGHYWAAALAFAGAVGVVAWEAGLFGTPSIAYNTFAARGEIWNLVALFFAMVATAGLAGTIGRRPLHNALLIATLVFVGLDAVSKLQFGPDHTLLPNANETAAVYGLLALLALFVAHDELTSPQSGTSGGTNKAALLPAFTFFAAMTGFLLTRAPAVYPALAAGIGVTALFLSFRSLPSPVGLALGCVGLAGLGAAVGLAMVYANPADPFGVAGFNDSVATALKGPTGLGAEVEGGMLQAWPAEAGVYGAGAMAAAVFLILLRLGLSQDRRRAPSRGVALAAGASTLAALAGGGGDGAAACATLAVIIGLSCAYADRLRAGARRQSRRPAAASNAMAFEDIAARLAA